MPKFFLGHTIDVRLKIVFISFIFLLIFSVFLAFLLLANDGHSVSRRVFYHGCGSSFDVDRHISNEKMQTEDDSSGRDAIMPSSDFCQLVMVNLTDRLFLNKSVSYRSFFRIVYLI